MGIIFAVLGVTAALLENRGISLEHVTMAEILRALATVLVLLSTAILLVIWVAKYIVSSKAAAGLTEGQLHPTGHLPWPADNQSTARRRSGRSVPVERTEQRMAGGGVGAGSAIESIENIIRLRNGPRIKRDRDPA